jgi:surface polysaccharide O-acyltransferase-like enzyme
MNSKTTNTQYLDTLRALATFGVIIIHVATPALKMNFGKNLEFWMSGNLIDSAVRFAVPIFLILTGATMLGREYDTIEFYKKRFVRVFIPFMFWMVVYWVFRWSVLHSWQQPKDFIAIIRWAADLFVAEGISKHFWYFYMILVVYLFVPFVGRTLRKLEKSTILLLIIGWVILNYFLRGTPMNLYGWSVDTVASKFLGWFLHAGYLVVGYYLVNLPPMTSKLRLLAAISFVLSIISCTSLTYIFSESAHKLDLCMYGYRTINTFIQSVALFLMIKDYNIRNQIALRVQQEICNYSYGIYLAHVMVIGIFFNWGFYWKIAHPLISIPLVSMGTMITCYLIVFVLRKFPGGKHVSG